MRDDAHLVPFADRLHRREWRRIEGIERSGGGVGRLAVGVPDVVQHLHFRRVLVDLVGAFVRPVEDPAVRAGSDLPLEIELERTVLLVTHQVAPIAIGANRAGINAPARRDATRLLIGVPSGERPGIEQRNPPAGVSGISWYDFSIPDR